ncbi:hypothetical protein [Rheinheimera oceanensis]|uniref:hypothetical protein n=1 Tax=Rheinheimera oceanensis TaxID=2817449 RepID=UPI001BFD98A0|nr:hypothetical protein [Rheinheimera oceanensis]
MIQAESLLEQAHLLINQRLQLVQSRYTGVEQLRAHDYQLLDCLKLLSAIPAVAGKALPQWLQWLQAQAPATALNVNDTRSFIQPEQARLLLSQIKWRRGFDQDIAVGDITLVKQQVLAGSDIDWRLASYVGLKLNPLTADTVLSSEALWYLATSAQTNLLSELIARRSTLAADHPLVVHCMLAEYVLGQRTQEDALVSRLSAQQELTTPALMLLIAGASDAVQAKIINQLAGNTTTLAYAVAAMGYSGQLKFVPLLAELSQQDGVNDIAADALAMLLGVIESDSLLSDRVALAQFQLKPHCARQLAGASISDLQLSAVWRFGNTQQRQLAACYRSLAAPATELLATDMLLGAN